MPYTDQIQSGAKVMQSINYGIANGLITNTIVAAGDTVALLISGVEANSSPTSSIPAEAVNNRFRVSRAIQLGADLGYFTNALLASLTTTAGLQALLTGIPTTQGPILLLE